MLNFSALTFLSIGLQYNMSLTAKGYCDMYIVLLKFTCIEYNQC